MDMRMVGYLDMRTVGYLDMRTVGYLDMRVLLMSRCTTQDASSPLNVLLHHWNLR